MKKLLSFIGGLCLASLSAIGAITDSLQGNLLQVQKGKLAPYDDTQLSNVKYLALYYSASWCGPCRRFTPKLVQFYNRVKRNNPEFELVFISLDHNEKAMAEYIKGDRMPWPALTFGTKTPLLKYAGDGIPCLVVVDQNGNVLIDSYEGQQYLGPDQAMERLGKLLSRNRAENKKAGTEFTSLFKPRGANAE